MSDTAIRNALPISFYHFAWKRILSALQVRIKLVEYLFPFLSPETLARMENIFIRLFSCLIILFSMHVTEAGGEDLENYTHKLSQSSANFEFWTTPPAERVFKTDTVPDATGSEIRVYAAKNEFEPFQLVVKPASGGNITISIDDFGSGIQAEIYQVKYVNIVQATDSLGKTGDYPDALWPIENGSSVAVSAGENTSFWFSLYVPLTTGSADYSTSIHIGETRIPVRLHVFDFAIPEALHVKSQMNVSHSTILSRYGVSGTGDEYWMYVEKIKQYFIDHRLTPKSVLWSGGLTSSGGAPYIDYDCTTGELTDPHGIWGFEAPAARYLDGIGRMNGKFEADFNSGTGFPSFMTATFRNNDASQDQRPSTFCGVTRGSGDWYTSDNAGSAFNQKWFSYIGHIESYLTQKGYIDRAYYYMANEPQDQADYDAVAWYSQKLKDAAPGFKLMVSEEPKPEIYNHADYTHSHQIDIWLPVLNNYDPAVSHDREVNHGEETWIYFLHGTRPPYFNPITLDHPGIESKLTGWFLWRYRVRGIAYYSLNNWDKNPWIDPMTDGHNGDTFMLYPPSTSNSAISYGSNYHRFVPSIRFELMRDSMEDYEYLFVLNNGQPVVNQSNPADTQVEKIVRGLTSYTRDSQFMYNLRRVIGLKNGNEISTIPDLQPPITHPRAEGAPKSYYINFQDPSSNPTVDPLVVNGRQYMKIGWNLYEDDTSLGYGWYGDMAHVKYQYLTDDSLSELQKSILYDDWGREKSFEFDLPNGTYNVTVSVGWKGRTYAHHKIVIEGVTFIDDRGTTPSAPYIVEQKQVTIKDNKLTMDMGIFDEYTMLNYMDIEPVGTGSDTEPTCITGLSVSPDGVIQVGQTAVFSVNASKSDSTLKYKFYYRSDYGTDQYNSAPWVVIQEYSTDNTCSYAFNQAGTYIVVARVVDDPENEPAALPIIGKVVTVGNGTHVTIRSLSSDPTETADTSSRITFTASASTAAGDDIYYQFYYCANYGTAAYETTPWTMVQEYSTKNTCEYQFPDAGDYVVVVRAVTDPENEPAALPIIGNTIKIK